MLKQQQSAGLDKKILMQAVAEAGEAGRDPGYYKEIFFSFSLYKIFKILNFLKYFFLIWSPYFFLLAPPLDAGLILFTIFL